MTKRVYVQFSGTLYAFREHSGRNTLSYDFFENGKRKFTWLYNAPKCIVEAIQSVNGTEVSVSFEATKDGKFPRNLKCK